MSGAAHHRQADARIRGPQTPPAAEEITAYGDQCADTDGLAAARDPMRAAGEVGL